MDKTVTLGHMRVYSRLSHTILKGKKHLNYEVGYNKKCIHQL